MPRQFEINLAFTADTEKAKNDIRDLQKQLSELTSTTISRTSEGALTQFSTDTKKAMQDVAQLSAMLDKSLNESTGRLDLRKFNASIKESGMDMQTYLRQMQQSFLALGEQGEKAFLNVAKSIMSADVTIKSTNKLVNDLWITLKNTAKWELSSSLVKGFTGAIQSAFSYAQDLNESLTNIQIVTGNSSAKMAEFAKQANIAAKELSTTTTEYSNAALIYYQQGLGDTETKQRTDITVQAANAAGISAEEMSDYLTAVWNSYNVPIDELEHYADVMAAVGAGTATSLEEISSAMEKVASVGDATGVSFEQLSAIVATVSSVTRQSAESIGTGYKTILARMADLELKGSVEEDGVTTTLGSVSSQLRAVGVDILDTNGDLRDMGVVLEELMGKWNGMDRATQQAIAIAIAGKRQYTQLLALMNNQDMYWDAVQMGVESDGETQRQAAVYAESWEAAQKRVKAAAEGVYDSLINDEFFIDLNDALAKSLGWLEKFIDNMGGLSGVLLQVGAIASNVFSKQIASSLSSLSTTIQGMTPWGQKKIQNEANSIRNNASALISQTLIESVSSEGIIGETKSNVVESQNQVYGKFINNASKYTDLQKRALQYTLDQYEALAKNVIKQAELTKEAQETADAESRLLSQISTRSRGSTSGNNMYERYSNIRSQLSMGQEIGKGISSFAQSGSMGTVQELANYIKRFSEAGMQIAGKDNTEKLFGRNVNKALDDLEIELEKELPNSANKAVSSIDSLVNKIQNTLVKALDDYARYVKNVEKEALKGAEEEIVGTGAPEEEREKVKKQVTEEIKNVDDSSNQTARLVQDTANFNQGTINLNNTLDELLPKMVATSEKITLIGNSMLTAAAISQSLTTSITTIGDAIEGEISWWDALQSILMSLPQMILSVGTMFKTLTTAMETATVATNGLSTASKGLMVFSGIGIALTALSAVITVFITLAQRKSQAIQDAAREAQELIKTNQELEETVNSLTTSIFELSDELQRQKDIGEDTTETYEKLTDQLKEAKDAYKQLGVSQQTLDLLAEAEAIGVATNNWDQYNKVKEIAEKEVQKKKQQEVESGLESQFKAVQDKLASGSGRIENIYTRDENGKLITTPSFVRRIESFGETNEKLVELSNSDKYKDIIRKASQYQHSDDFTLILDAVDPRHFLEQYELLGEFLDDMQELGIENLDQYRELSVEYQAAAELAPQMKASQELKDSYHIEDTFEQKYKETVSSVSESLEDYFGNIDTAKEKTIEFLRAPGNVAQFEAMENLLNRFENKFSRPSFGFPWDEHTDYKDQFLNVEEERNKLENYLEGLSDSELSIALQVDLSDVNSFDTFVEEYKSKLEKITEEVTQHVPENLSSAIAHLQTNEELTEEEISSLKELEVVYKDLQQIQDRSSRAYIERLQEIRQLTAATEENNAIEAYEDLINKLSSSFDENLELKPGVDTEAIEDQLDKVFNKRREIDVLFKEDLDASIEEVTNDAKQLSEAAGLIGENFLVTADNITAVEDAFPGILKGYQITSDGLIQLNADVAQSAIDNATTQAQANQQSVLIKIQAEKTYAEGMKNMYLSMAQQFADLQSSNLTNEEKTQQAEAIILGARAKSNELFNTRTSEYSKANALLDETYAQYTQEAETEQLKTSVENTFIGYSEMAEASKKYAEAAITNAQAVAAANKAAAEGKPEAANTSSQLKGGDSVGSSSAEYKESETNENEISTDTVTSIVNATTGETIDQLLENLKNPYGQDEEGKKASVDATIKLLQESALTGAKHWENIESYWEGQEAKVQAFGVSVPNLVNTAGRDTSGSSKLGDEDSGTSDSSKPGDEDSEEPKTRTPQHTEKQDTVSDLELPQEVVERYENTDNLLESIERRLTKIGNEREGLWGDGFIAKLDEENEALQDQIDLLDWQMNEAKKYAEEDLGALRSTGIGVQLDENGIITNAEQIRAAIQQMRIDEAKAYDAQVNTANADYDAQVNALAADDSEGENALKEQNEATLQGFEDAHDAKTEYFDSLEEALDNYDEAWNKYWDNAEEREEILQQIRENNLEKIIHKLDIQMEMTEFERNNMEFLRNNFREGLFGIQDNINFDNMEFSNYALDLQNINAAIEDLNIKFANGEISEEQYATTLKDLTDQARDASEAMLELGYQIGEYWVEALEDANSIMEDSLDNFDHLLSLMDNFESLTKLITSEDNYSGLSSIYDDIVEISRDALTASQANYDFLAKQESEAWKIYQDAIADGLGTTNPKMLDQLEENWQTARDLSQQAQEQMLSDAQAFGEAAQQQYENTVNQIMKEYEDAVTSGKGFDWMNAQMEHLQLKDTEYLTETNKLYQTQKLIRQANLDLENTENKAAQNRLQSFIKETEELENQTNVSAYALGIQERKYQVLLAEIALQEAQNAKDQVRLQRDTEGNFNYVYTADEDSIAKAEQRLADAQNDLYNYVREKENEIRQAELEAQQEHAQNIADIWITYANDEAARNVALAEENKRFQDEIAMYKELSNLSMEASDQAYSDSYAANLNDRYLATEESTAYQIDANAQLEDANTSLQENNEVVSDVINKNYGDMQSKSNEFATEASNDLREVEGVMKTVTASTQQWADTMGSLIGSVTNHYQELAASCRTAMEVISGFQSTVDYSLLGYNAGSYAEALQHWTTRDTAIEYNIDNKGQFTENDLGGLDLVQGIDTDLSALILSSGTKEEALRWASLREAKKSDQVSGNYYDSVQSTKAFLAQRFGENSPEYQWIIDKLREENIPGFDTGGYTGEFDGGKLALLHEKELVLNKQDTQNLLDTIDIVDKLLSTLNYQNLLAGFGISGLENNIRQDSDKLEQEVTIHAEFPNVQTHDEIEQAIYNLTNTAAQYANRKRL